MKMVGSLLVSGLTPMRWLLLLIIVVMVFSGAENHNFTQTQNGAVKGGEAEV
jgi:hypothetical protein